MCLIPSMFQPDLFVQDASKPTVAASPERMDLPGVLERLTAVCERPRYSFMVLNLIAQASTGTGSAGPYVRSGDRRVPVREWLCMALAPMAQRDPSRAKIAERVRRDLKAEGTLPRDEEEAARVVEEHVCRRVRASGLTNVSRAVSELVRAGLVRRHYQGYRVDHHNRGAQRQAVYTVTDETLKALGLN